MKKTFPNRTFPLPAPSCKGYDCMKGVSYIDCADPRIHPKNTSKKRFPWKGTSQLVDFCPLDDIFPIDAEKGIPYVDLLCRIYYDQEYVYLDYSTIEGSRTVYRMELTRPVTQQEICQLWSNAWAKHSPSPSILQKFASLLPFTPNKSA